MTCGPRTYSQSAKDRPHCDKNNNDAPYTDNAKDAEPLNIEIIYDDKATLIPDRTGMLSRRILLGFARASLIIITISIMIILSFLKDRYYFVHDVRLVP